MIFDADQWFELGEDSLRERLHCLKTCLKMLQEVSESLSLCSFISGSRLHSPDRLPRASLSTQHSTTQ
eukprot:NODE_10684_length_432_cov_5.446475_g9571_i0.p2 GENE.NODE_10684_length_432_cov_5.446475_g9571_i0~~NODE_10684_length_432_cov_5.446475_g9571_i0.p2  ORF type:complete len:68 (+),score=3.61 NODE_10684_length_432_cov_5.446475_g9571_i0:212-415(+)